MKLILTSAWPILVAASFILTSSSTLHGGSFSTDFNSGPPGGATAYPVAFVDSSGGVGDSGVLKLTTAVNDQVGSFVLDDLDPGQQVSSFTATFKLRMGGGTAVPADGISFNFAPDLPAAAFNEEGAGSGLTITFDAYDNGAVEYPEGPEIRINYGGAPIANRKLTTQLRTGAGFVDVKISYSSAGTLTLVYNNLVLVTNLFVASPMPVGARFGFGARTGGLNQDQFIDDLSITTTPISLFYVQGPVSPTPPLAALPASVFQVVLTDAGGIVDPASVKLTFDGAAVNPTVSKVDTNTTVSYDPPGSLLFSSIHKATVQFGYTGNPATESLDYNFTVTQTPLWGMAAGSTNFLTVDASSTPNQRSIAYNPLTKHLYVVSRTAQLAGLTVNVLEPATGAFLYRMNTNGIVAAGTIMLANIAVADDGSLYACNIATTNGVTMWRWADDNPATAPAVVFAGKLSALTAANVRWGDTLAVTGSGADTRIILDCQQYTTNFAVLTATDSTPTGFTATFYTNTYSATTQIGRSLQFGPTNTFWLKKKSTTAAPAMLPLQLLRYESDQTATVLESVAAFHPQVAGVWVDTSRNLAAGIFYNTNTSPTTAPADRLLVWDISNLNSPLQIGQYNFPTNHQANANWIGQVIFGPDKIFALEGNNGLIAVPVTPPTVPALNIAFTGGAPVLSWTNTVPGFVLQATPALSMPAWAAVDAPVVVNGNLNAVTDTLGSSNNFYRIVMP